MEYSDVRRRSLQASQECVWHDKNGRNNDACVCALTCEGTATQLAARRQLKPLDSTAFFFFFKSFVYILGREERNDGAY